MFDIQEIVPAFLTWENPSRRPDWYLAVNVDMIMNMEILAWSTLNGGGLDLLDYAIE